jgi:hypothetical protein
MPPAAIVATGFGDRDTGGGAFVVEHGAVRRIDWLASTGLAVDAAGARVARLLRDTGEAGELLISDGRGIELYRRVDGLHDAHDVIWHDDGLVVSSTSANALLWLGPGGERRRTWTAPGTGDAWHLNSLTVQDGRLLACAFGRFERHRGWTVPGASEGRGFVFDVDSGEVVLHGLTRPHDPFRLDGRWAACDSGTRSVVVFEDDGRTIAERVSLDGWTRGVALDDAHVYVGLSVHRGEADGATASIAVLDRATLRLRAQLPVSCREIYALAAVPAPLVAGLERGFRTNALRAADDDQHALFRAAGVEPVRLWASPDPLPPEACRAELRLELPPAMCAGDDVALPWTLRNTGGAILHGAHPYPVRLGWRWFDATGTALVSDGGRCDLPHAVAPGQSASGVLRISAPAGTGRRVLRVAPVQEHVRWFDDADPRYGVAGEVVVETAGLRSEP